MARETSAGLLEVHEASMTDADHPSFAVRWITAIRPKTLAAVLAPCAIGAGWTLGAGQFDGIGFSVALAGGIAIQIVTNLVNDLVDAARGTDTPDRVGPTRVVSSGWIAPRAIGFAVGALVLVAAACAFWLITERSFWFAPLAAASLLFAFAYSAGPIPLSYTGTGDLVVILFFGALATAGTVAAQTGEWSIEAAGAGVGAGLLSTALLAVNNLRDVETDRLANKRTLAVRCGTCFARSQVVLCVVGAGVVAFLYGTNESHTGVVLACIPCAALVPALYRIVCGLDGVALNRVLGQIGVALIAYGILFGAGLAL
ncbi:MAG: 1,4-dihydroxy-2-naphthoate octaprenyltransferase [Planctomycetota bacterium]|nr:1,4-dihydroxy-2-naphthoate octaprenyltransferase [Planctomycetota bacterium]